MKISNLTFIAIRPRGNLVGWANLIWEESFYLGDIAVHTKPNGELSLGFPQKKIGDSKVAIYHPINRQTEELIRRAVEEKVKELNLFEISEE